MPPQRYSVTQPPIETLFTWIKSGEMSVDDYATFLSERRKLMAAKIRTYFQSL